jgi:hypothetical protein
MNSTILGGSVRHELKKAYVKGEAEADLCVGGCDNWNKTAEGIKRYTALKTRWKEQQGHS